MKTAKSTPELLFMYVIGALWFIGIAICAEAKPKHEAGPSHSRSTSNQILETAVRYYHNPVYKQDQPWICFLSPEGGGTDKELVANLNRSGIRLNTGSAPSQLARPKHYTYLYLGKIKWLSSRRVKMSLGLEQSLDWPIYSESYGVMYLEYTKHRWIVDEKRTRLSSGD